MARRAIVHVGLPRTGTTTLQRVLAGIRPQLLAAGILYPELTPRLAAEPHLSHQHLGEALDGRRPRQDRAELLDSLSAQLAATQADTVLLSYEGLCLASPWLGVPRRLATLFAQRGFAMEILATIKPQDELVNSSYTWRMQFLREGRPFPEYFRAEIGQSGLDLAGLLRAWHVACDGRMFAVPTRDPRSERPLVERVLDEIGILPRVAAFLGTNERTLVENRSPGPVVVEVARQLRRGGAHLALGRRARDAMRFVEDAAHARGINAPSFIGLDPAMRAAAAARWASANDRFAWQVWSEPWSMRVAAQPPSPGNEIARWGDPGHQVEAIVRDTCERFQLRLADGPGLSLRDAAEAAGARLGRMVRYGYAMIS